MGSFLSVLSTIASVIVAIPKILEFVYQIRRAIEDLSRRNKAKEEDVRREEMKKKETPIKDAQAKGDDDAQDTGLGDIVTDYNRR